MLAPLAITLDFGNLTRGDNKKAYLVFTRRCIYREQGKFSVLIIDDQFIGCRGRYSGQNGNFFSLEKAKGLRGHLKSL